MGRGEARARRIAEYFARPCLECLTMTAVANALKLTTVRGEPLADDEYAVKVGEAKARVSRLYW
jgi:hypothetical protein